MFAYHFISQKVLHNIGISRDSTNVMLQTNNIKLFLELYFIFKIY